MLTIRPATLQDVQAIMSLLYPGYFNETAFKGLKYSPHNTTVLVQSWIASEDSTCLLAFEGKELVGVTSLMIGQTYYEDVEGDIQMFYVIPRCRGTEAGRRLRDVITNTAELLGCKAIYASTWSGVSELNDKLWVNMFKKIGFQVLGINMAKFEK